VVDVLPPPPLACVVVVVTLETDVEVGVDCPVVCPGVEVGGLVVVDVERARVVVVEEEPPPQAQRPTAASATISSFGQRISSCPLRCAPGRSFGVAQILSTQTLNHHPVRVMASCIR
jgi:hypothetical protein